MKKFAILTVAAAVSLMAADGAALFKRCAGCHGAHGEKHALGKSAIIKDMSKADILAALKEYKAGKRNAHGMGALMIGQVANLSEEDMKAIADYIGK